MFNVRALGADESGGTRTLTGYLVCRGLKTVDWRE